MRSRLQDNLPEVMSYVLWGAVNFIYSRFSGLFIPKGYVDPPYMTAVTKETGSDATTYEILRPQRALCAKPGV